jgi:hypothetical protein
VVTKAPWCDEAWFGIPAYNLAVHGFMGTTVLDPASSTWKSVKLTGIDTHTYWVMPLNLLLNAASFRILGFSVFSMRLLSLLWGLVTLAAWGAILWKLTGLRWFALAGAGLIAIDFHFLAQAADGRMDAMAVALGWSAVAAYLMLRDASFPRAVVVSHSLAALSLFTHPNGIALAAILVCTTLYFDRKRIRIGSVALAALPYLAVAAGWGLYILQSPGDFMTQFLGNAGGRGPTITTPLLALREEFVRRYLQNYGMASWSSLAGRINVIPLLFFALGAAACLAIPAIRSHRGYRLLLIWTAIMAFFLAELEGLKTPFYLIYITPLLTVLLLAAGAWCWSNFVRLRWVVASALAVFVLLQASRTVIADSRHPRHSTYDPAVRYLVSQFNAQTSIMGGAEFVFGVGPDWRILDDIRLGYNTGKKPDVVVIDPAWEDRIQALQDGYPEIYGFVQRVLKSDFREVYNHEGYRILVRAERPL